MTQTLRDLQAAAIATFTSIAGGDAPLSFVNDGAALLASQKGMAICDRYLQIIGSVLDLCVSPSQIKKRQPFWDSHPQV